jgi:hypothetical protein
MRSRARPGRPADPGASVFAPSRLARPLAVIGLLLVVSRPAIAPTPGTDGNRVAEDRGGPDGVGAAEGRALAEGPATARIAAAAATPTPGIDVPDGSSPVIDGTVSPGEWEDAGQATITVTTDWTVGVLFKHDGRHLYVAFTNLTVGAEELYPEVLAGTVVEGQGWLPTDHWFHASYQDCDASGRPNDYTTCAPARPGWKANNFPLAAGADIEVRISFERLGMDPESDRHLRLAFVVTDTRERWMSWPAAASIDSPAQWATARLR